jgi:hypothetical protein
MRCTAGLLAVPLVLAPALGPRPVHADQPAPAISEPRVKLVTPGQAPLRALRYKAAVGHKGQMTMSLNMTMTMTIGTQALPATTLPEMRYGMDYTVTSVSPAGDIRYEFRLKDPQAVGGTGVAAPILEAVRGALEKMKDLRGHAVVTSRGVTKEADVVMPDGADPQLRQLVDGMRQTMRQVSAPFPEEAVGLGAKWETTQRVLQNGVTLTQVSTSELTSLQSDKGSLNVSVNAKAEPQQVQAPNLPPGARMDLSSLDSQGDGVTAFDLGRLVPADAKVKTHTEMKATILAGADKQAMEMKMDMTVALSSAP